MLPSSFAPAPAFATLIAALLAAKWIAELTLQCLNQKQAKTCAQQIPAPLKNSVDPAAYRKSINYTLAKSRLEIAEDLYNILILTAALFSGVLPEFLRLCLRYLGNSVPALAAFVFLASAAFSFTSLPFDWFSQFKLEERFGFNTTTPTLWWTDRLKGFILAALLGWPLLALILKLVHWTGPTWWLWAWAAILTFQLVLLVAAPRWILPLFNKLTPLPEGPLRQKLLQLGQRTGFHAKTILVIDGSKRSRHSNAFFTGFGRFRKIVLFDTLIAQLSENELEAVLAHEIGHYKLGHIPKILAASAAGLFLALFTLSFLARQNWFYAAFGFPLPTPDPSQYPQTIATALLLFGLLSGLASFWIAPIANRFSRTFEYQADAFAAKTIGNPAPLVLALRKLNEKNLSNLIPHPLYSGFYYSHPTLLEREHALATS